MWYSYINISLQITKIWDYVFWTLVKYFHINVLITLFSKSIRHAPGLYYPISYIVLDAVLLFISKMWYHLAFDVISPWLLYNYRLLMRSTPYHVDRVWYWLTDAVGGGLPIPDKVYMVPSRPKSKVYNCFIKFSGILHGIDFTHKETSMALSAASKIGAKWGAYIVTS